MSALSKVTPIGDADAVFLDFDGTLTAIQDDRDAVRLDAGCATVLERVAARLDGALAIISGRDVRDLAGRTPHGLWRLGAHGLEVCAPDEAPPAHRPTAPAALRETLEGVARELDGVTLEDKGLVLAMHYRARPEAGDALRRAVEAAVADVPDYKMQQGKLVIEAKPKDANKGDAIRRLRDAAPFRGRRLIMVGDDTTDEDAFEAVLEAGGVAIKVGEGESRARERLPDPHAVHRWLERGAAA